MILKTILPVQTGSLGTVIVFSFPIPKEFPNRFVEPKIAQGVKIDTDLVMSDSRFTCKKFTFQLSPQYRLLIEQYV